jgi:hypothetical protein
MRKDNIKDREREIQEDGQNHRSQKKIQNLKRRDKITKERENHWRRDTIIGRVIQYNCSRRDIS